MRQVRFRVRAPSTEGARTHGGVAVLGSDAALGRIAVLSIGQSLGWRGDASFRHVWIFG
jgi:hypothetical protein